MAERIGVATDSPGRFERAASAAKELRPRPREASKSGFGFDPEAAEEIELHALAVLISKSRNELRQRVAIVCVPRSELPAGFVQETPAHDYPIIGLEHSHRSLLTGTEKGLAEVSAAIATSATRRVIKKTAAELATRLEDCLSKGLIRDPFLEAARNLAAAS